jgi:DNA-binding transcriptional LysR family regulator
MTQNQIDCFLSVCETLNFTATAKELYYTPQGVSKLVSALEEELGLELFQRDKQGKSLTLTPAGQYCKDNLIWSQRKLARTMGEVHGWYQRLAGSFRLGISEWVDPNGKDMIRVLMGFRRELPDLSFEARSDSNDALIASLGEGQLDAVILSGGQAILGNEFDAAPLAREHISVVVPESVCGPEWTGLYDPYCWGVPYVQSPVKKWGRLESEQVIRKELASLGLFPAEVQMVPNVSSLSASLLVTRCVTITDTRFGFTPRLPRLRFFPLEQVTDAELLCVWSLRNENPRVDQFVRYARQVLGDEEELAELDEQLSL